MTAVDYVFLVLEEHPYGREMLRQLLAAGLPPRAIIEERSETATLEREKFVARLGGELSPPTFTDLLDPIDIRREVVAHHNGGDCIALLRALQTRLLVLGGTRILAPEVFARVPDGCLNSHPGLLPEVRGSASVAWAVLLDLPVGCTCHFIDAAIDTGPIVVRRPLAVHRGDTYERLCAGTVTLAGTLMVEAVRAYASGRLRATPQPAGGIAHKNMPDELVAEVRAKLDRCAYSHYVD